MFSAERLLKRLIDGQVDFVIVGGFAAVAHGSARLTQDLDVCAPLDAAGLSRLIAALAGAHPRLRTIPPRPLPSSVEALQGFKDLNLLTEEGELDILGEVAGVGGWPEALRQSVEVSLWGRPVRILDLEALIASKRALSREKDLPQLAELEVLRSRRGR